MSKGNKNTPFDSERVYVQCGKIPTDKPEYIFNEKVEPKSTRPVIVKYMLNKENVVLLNYLSWVILLSLFLREKKNIYIYEERHHEKLQLSWTIDGTLGW